MQKRKFDELVSYFNKKVSEMEIETKYKMELLGMVTALGCAHEKEMSDLSETKRDSSDTISRQAAIEALAKHEKSKGHNYTLFVDIVSECAEIIRDLPSAEPVRMKGKWEYVDYGGFGNWHCTACRAIAIVNGNENFCPNCGADMRGEDDGN